ncbi:MAG: hypothetical protein GXO79_14630 [Chlorobi bacterium]|nr:hypothetical protein [Chlorobiota bacterium]
METNDSNASILDWLQFDLSNFFLQEYEEVYSEEIEGLYCIDYEKKLPQLEFNIFDMMRLRVFSKVKDIESSEHINTTFFTRENEWNISKLNNLVELLFNLYGLDQNGKGLLNDEDISDLKLNIFNRTWTLGTDENVHMLQLTKKEEEGLEFHIVFLKSLLRCLGKI